MTMWAQQPMSSKRSVLTFRKQEAVLISHYSSLVEEVEPNLRQKTRLSRICQTRMSKTIIIYSKQNHSFQLNQDIQRRIPEKIVLTAYKFMGKKPNSIEITLK